MQNIVYLATSLPRSKCASVATSAMLFKAPKVPTIHMGAQKTGKSGFVDRESGF